jgi:hypothetical protein
MAVKKEILHIYVDLHLLLSLEATGVGIPIGHAEMPLASLYKSPLSVERCGHHRALKPENEVHFGW